MMYKVAGTSFRDWNPDIVKKGILSLVPEPDNEYDKNAIKIFSDEIHIGYVPKESILEILPLINSEWQIVECDWFHPNDKEKPEKYLIFKLKEEIDLGNGWKMDTSRNRTKDGKTYYNISSVLNRFNFENDEFWERTKMNSFQSFEQYREWMDDKSRMGSCIHRCSELGICNAEICKEFGITLEEKPVVQFFPQWKPSIEEVFEFVSAISLWKKENEITILEREKIISWGDVASPCDLLVEHKGEKFVVDLKISKKTQIRYEIQTHFYAKAWEMELETNVKPSVLLLGVDNKKHYRWIKEGYKTSREFALRTIQDGVFQLNNLRI